MSSEVARQLAASSPASFAHVTSSGLWVPYEHLILLNDHLLRLVAGDIDRLLVTMPPQHGKSELISRYFPAWYLGTFPDRKVLLGSYQARYANSWGRKARELLEEFGPWVWGVDVADEPRAADWWFTNRGGYMASDGAGGAFTGKGANCLPGETVVSTEAGPIRISRLAHMRIRPRALVLSQGEARYEPIVAARVTSTDELYDITTDSGHRVRATGRHRFFVHGSGYVEAKDLRRGDRLVTHELAQQPDVPEVPHDAPQITESTIVAVERVRTERQPVYDLQVAGPSHFFADGVLVHNCLIIDDPIKGHEDAQSEVMRNKVWDWWVATLASRLQQINAVVLVQTRWHEDDLAGRLLRNEPDEWTHLNLPALAEDDDPLGREPGEPLCPELHDREKIERQKKKGGYWFSALYQQRPAPAEGFLFKRTNFCYWREEHDFVGATPRKWFVLSDGEETRRHDAGFCTYFQVVDAAISGKETADFSVIATWAATPQDDLLLLGLERRHFEQQNLVEFLAAANDAQGRPPMWVERFGAGRNPLSILARRGHPVMEIPVEAGAQSNKVTRAFGAISMYEQHRVFHPMAAPWLGDFEGELVTFPNAAHDDQVDVTSYAARLLQMGATGRRGGGVRVAGRTVGPQPHSAGIRSQQF